MATKKHSTIRDQETSGLSDPMLPPASSQVLQIGLVLPNTGALASARSLFASADMAEDLGLDSLWTADHLALPVEPASAGPSGTGHRPTRLSPDHQIWDPFMVLSALAARTQRIKLGISVYLTPLRHPLSVAKMAVTLDQLSHGRLVLGVGLGWLREEYAAVGASWTDRGALLDEQIRCLRELWSSKRPSFAGKFYQLQGIGFEPKPSNGTIPIIVGGNTGPAMRRAASLGDGWHLSNVAPAALVPLLDKLRSHCNLIGRRFDTLSLSKRSIFRITESPVAETRRTSPVMGTVEQIVDILTQYQRIGLHHIALAPAHPEMDLQTYLNAVKVIAKEIKPLLS